MLSYVDLYMGGQEENGFWGHGLCRGFGKELTQETVQWEAFINVVVYICVPLYEGLMIPYFPAHKTHRDFFVRNFIYKKKNDECILILVIYWKKTGLLHTKISNHNIIYSS